MSCTNEPINNLTALGTTTQLPTTRRMASLLRQRQHVFAQMSDVCVYVSIYASKCIRASTSVLPFARSVTDSQRHICQSVASHVLASATYELLLGIEFEF